MGKTFTLPGPVREAPVADEALEPDTIEMTLDEVWEMMARPPELLARVSADELARLRAIEAAARAVVEATQPGHFNEALLALADALDAA